MDLSMQTVVDALKPCDVDHNKSFIKCPSLSAFNGLPIESLKNKIGIRELSRNSIGQVFTCKKMFFKTEKSIISEPAVLAPFANIAGEAVMVEVAALEKCFVFLVAPSPPLSRSDSQLDEECKDRKKR